MRFAIVLAALLVAVAPVQAQTLRATATASDADGNIAHRAAGTVDSRGSCGAIAPGLPAGTTAGDLLIALVVAKEDGATVSMAGWNTYFSHLQPGIEYQPFIFWRVATGGDATSIVQAGTCSLLVGQIAAFSGVDTANPFQNNPLPGANWTYSNSATITSGTETTTSANAMLVFAVLIGDNNATGVPAGFSESFDTGSGTGSDGQVSLKYQLQTTAGLKGPVSVAKGGGSDPNHGVLFSLRPASSPLTINVPAGTANRDVMVASIAVRPCSSTNGGACTTTVSTPAGWTLVNTVDQTGGGVTGGYGNRLFVYQRAATGAEPASYTWTIGGTPVHAGAAGSIASFFGIDADNPVVVSGGAATASAFTHQAPDINTGSVTNTMLVASFAENSAATWTAPGGMTEALEVSSVATTNNDGISMTVAWERRAAAGLTGTRTATASNPPTADTGTAHMLALRPAPVRFDVINGEYVVHCAATPMSVTIIARDASGNLVPGYVGLVNLSTSTALGTWTVGTANGTLTDAPAGDGAATYQFVASDNGVVTLNLSHTAVTSLVVYVQDNATGYTAVGATTINFITDGYAVIADTVQVAGRPQAMRAEHRVAPGCGLSNANGHNGNKNTMRIWLTLDPSHPGAATLPGATAVTNVSPLPTAEPADNITLGFSGGQANFTLTTTDVGKYVVNLRDAATARRGSSPAITTRPFALAIRGASAAAAIQKGTDHNSTVLVPAGDDFPLTVAAYLWAAGDDSNDDGVPNATVDVTDNGLVPRFAWDTTLSVPAGAILPAGGVDGTLTLGGAAPTIAAASYSGGAASVANARYSEVGSATIRATATNYLNTPGANVTGDSSMDNTGAFVGRFRPKHFALSAGAVTNRSIAACGVASTFSYMNEALSLAFTLTAQNTQNATTQNYTGLYAKLALGTVGNLSLGARSGATALTGRIDAGSSSSGTWTAGVANVTVSTGITRANPDNPDGPYASLSFGIAPNNDGVQMNTLDLDADVSGTPERKNVGVTTEVRFGRLRMQNALGSEKLQLPIPIETQYWNGTGFVTNAADSCTSIPRTAFSLNFTPVSNLVACETGINATDVTFAAGVGTLILSAPGTGNNGSVLLSANLGTVGGNSCAAGVSAVATSVPMSYLLGRWNDASDPDSSAATAYDDKPSARAAFGLYGSQPKNFIYFRENY